MASSHNNKSVAIRSSAVLTTGEVAATTFALDKAWAHKVHVQVDFTLGSLTNGIFKIYVSADGTTYYDYRSPTGAAITQTLTADSTISIPVDAVGWTTLKVSVQGTGTVTNSLAAISLRYMTPGSQ